VLAGVVLAGGRSTRFGSDKLRATYRGVPLLHHAVLRLAELCDDVVVVLAPGVDDAGLPPGVRTTHDPTGAQGPLVGLHAGLAAAARSEAALVIGGDMPEMQAAVAREMARVLDEAAVDAVVLADAGRWRPMPCVLRTSRAAAAVHRLVEGGERRLGAAIDALRTAVIDEATWTALDPGRRSVFDVDVPADLDR
jgi:molybdopterin-guanine dinucleotide biosynthesis protein A